MSRYIDEYSPKEAAAELRIPYRLILRAIKEGKLRCTRYSASVYRIKSEHLAEWKQSLTT